MTEAVDNNMCRITIELNTDETSAVLADRLDEQVQHVIRDLASDLALTSSWRVYYDGGFSGEQALHALKINDIDCRIPLSRTAVDHGQHILEEITEALYVNREMLLSPKGENKSEQSDLLEYERDLIRLGVRPGRLSELSHWLGDLDTDVAVERAIQEFERAIQDAKGSVRILVGSACYREIAKPRIKPGTEGDSEPVTMESLLQFANDGLFTELGLVFGGPQVQLDPELLEHEFRIQINDLRLPRQVCLLEDEFLVNDTPGRLSLLGIESRAATNPATRQPGAIVRGTSAADRCERGGLTTWDQPGFIILHAAHAIRRAAGWLLNSDVTDFCLNKLGESFPRLASSATSAYSLIELTRTMRSLLQEEISVRNLPRILDHLLLDEIANGIVVAGKDEPPRWLVLSESVRCSLRRYISAKYARQSNTLVVYIMDPEFESRLTAPQELSKAERFDLIGAIAHEVAHLPPSAMPPVILTNRSIRHRLRAEIAKEFPYMNVVSYHELWPDLNIQPVARITPVH